MTQPLLLRLTWVLTTLSLLYVVRGQTLAQDLAAVKFIFEKLQGFSFSASDPSIPKCPPKPYSYFFPSNPEKYQVVCSGNDRVTGLNLKICNYHSSIPSEIGILTGLTYLSLTGNNSASCSKLSGPIPTQLGQLKKLTTLVLSNNNLSGPIPAILGDLAELGTLLLDGNMLSGPIPLELSNLKRLTTLSLHNNKLTDSIPNNFDSYRH